MTRALGGWRTPSPRQAHSVEQGEVVSEGSLTAWEGRSLTSTRETRANRAADAQPRTSAGKAGGLAPLPLLCSSMPIQGTAPSTSHNRWAGTAAVASTLSSLFIVPFFPLHPFTTLPRAHSLPKASHAPSLRTANSQPQNSHEPPRLEPAEGNKLLSPHGFRSFT